jgi:hypothetical protein
MLQNLTNILRQVVYPGRKITRIPGTIYAHNHVPLQAIRLKDFLEIEVPRREMLLSPILPERSLAMLYAPRGIGK